MKIIYNCSNINEFEIDNYGLNKPLVIKKAKLNLTVHRNYNIVYLFNKIGSYAEQQEWIFEPSNYGNDNVYIRSSTIREGGVRYLGCPNKNNIVYLYTSKNKYTLWQVKNISANKYQIVYSGDKYDITKHTIVVARYNECLNWLLPYDDCTIVYNKGDDNIAPFSNVIKLDNVGREGHTYLYHIINNYNKLSDRVTFSQGDPITHNSTFLYGLDNFENFALFQPLGVRWLETKQIPPNQLVEKYLTRTDYGLEYLVLDLNGDLNYAEPYYFFDDGVDFLIKKYKKDYKLPQMSICIAANFLEKCKFPYEITNKSLETIKFTFSALFSVVRTNIIMYEEIVFRNILKELISINPQGGANGYILERLWYYMFDNL
jgi:hypothetical protein